MIKQFQVITLLFSILIIGCFFRFFILNSVPSGLHGDELGIGYNAFSLLLTGRDEYNYFLPLTFRADFTPVIFYATVPFISFMNLTETSTRLPTALIGVFCLLAVYVLFKRMLKSEKIALLTSFFISISSWHIRTSRIAVEMTWALFFQILATVFFLTFIKKGGKIDLIIAFTGYMLSLFSYQTPRLLTPILVISLWIIYRKPISKSVSRKFFLFLYGLFIVTPLLLYFSIQPLHKMRFAGISVFTSWKASLGNHEGNFIIRYFSPTSLSLLFETVTINYIKHFDLNTFFFDNSQLRYYQINNLGLFYIWQIPFIAFGFVTSLKNWRRHGNALMIVWFLISPFAAAFTTGVPTANIARALMLILPIEYYCASGIIFFANNYQQSISTRMRKVTYLALSIVVGLNLVYFNRNYFLDSPKQFAEFWGHYLKKAAAHALSYEPTVDKIIFTDVKDQSYIYVLFYGKKDPYWLFKSQPKRDNYIGYLSFGNYEFRSINWIDDSSINHSIIIGKAEDIPENIEYPVIKIDSLNGEIKFKIVKIDKPNMSE